MGLEEGMDNPSSAENPLGNGKLKSESIPQNACVPVRKGSWVRVPGMSKRLC